MCSPKNPQSQFHRPTSDNIIAADLPRTPPYTRALSVNSIDHRVDSLEFNIVYPIKAANEAGKVGSDLTVLTGHRDLTDFSPDSSP